MYTWGHRTPHSFSPPDPPGTRQRNGARSVGAVTCCDCRGGPRLPVPTVCQASPSLEPLSLSGGLRTRGSGQLPLPGMKVEHAQGPCPRLTLGPRDCAPRAPGLSELAFHALSVCILLSSATKLGPFSLSWIFQEVLLSMILTL